jgi:hypothetical protein
MSSKLYLCKNTACALGSLQQPGRFTGPGITKEALNLLTGQPVEQMKKGVDYGEGFCPNCGQKGEEYDSAQAIKDALAEAEAQHKARVKAIKEGVA